MIEKVTLRNKENQELYPKTSIDQVEGLSSTYAAKTDIPEIVDNVITDDASKALSAKQGKVLQDEISSLKAIGRFLSSWDCTTGLPKTNPDIDPYEYKPGDYYIVSVVGETNYRPTGTSYTAGVASTVVETDEVDINNYYRFDGQTWIHEGSAQKEVTFANIGGDVYENENLAAEFDSVYNELDAKQNKLPDGIIIDKDEVEPYITLQNEDSVYRTEAHMTSHGLEVSYENDNIQTTAIVETDWMGVYFSNQNGDTRDVILDYNGIHIEHPATDNDEDHMTGLEIDSDGVFYEDSETGESYEKSWPEILSDSGPSVDISDDEAEILNNMISNNNYSRIPFDEEEFNIVTDLTNSFRDLFFDNSLYHVLPTDFCDNVEFNVDGIRVYMSVFKNGNMVATAPLASGYDSVSPVFPICIYSNVHLNLE